MLGVNVAILGQDGEWVRMLARLCRNDEIHFLEKPLQGQIISYIITEESRIGNGMYAGIPFLVVAKEKDEKKELEAFRLGADDYLVRPVSPRIMRVRLLGILRRYGLLPVTENMQAQEEYLTQGERRILGCLKSRPGKVFTRAELLEQAYRGTYDGIDRNVDNYIRQIRKKAESAGGKIETVYGVGYRYRSDGTDSGQF